MAEYIEREALIEIAEQQGHVSFDDIINEPAADVAPVRHGRWEYDNTENFWKCSCCGVNAPIHGDFLQLKTNYCPNCGARMRGAEDE